MAFLLNKASMFTRSSSSSSSQKKMDDHQALQQSRRGFHIELGAREKALLEEDPALKRFKSHKKTVNRIKRGGDILTIVVVAGCCYEMYVRATQREVERKEGRQEKGIY